jgi:hypothetical protein
MRCALVIAVLMSASGLRVGHAQAEPQGKPVPLRASLPVGAVVRFWSDNPTIDERLSVVQRATDDSLHVRWEIYPGDTTYLSLAYTNLRRVDVAMARTRGQGAARGLVIGLLAALAMDGVAAVCAEAQSNRDTATGVALVAGAATPVVILGGTLIGAAIPGERWSVAYRR